MHWYDGVTGEPRYEIPKASGKGLKVPTLADAKKLGFVPSVTSVLRILDKPGLDIWAEEQAILAALTHPLAQADMPHAERLSIIRQDAKAQAQKAAETGTAIHDAVEWFLREGRESDLYAPHARGAKALVDEITGSQSWKVEAWLPGGLRYGGKCDLHNADWLIDFKTKEFTQRDIDSGKLQGWPEQHVQLVAYDHGFGGARRRLANVFISTSAPGLAYWYQWPDEKYDVALKQWHATLDCWYAWKWRDYETSD